MLAETPPNLLEVQHVQDVTIVRFVRRTILDPATIEILGDRLLALVREEGCTRLVIDFTRVESMTSAMLGKLAGLHAALIDAGGKVVFCNVGDFLRHILTVCKFPETIPIHADEPAAMAAVGAHA